MGLIKKHENSCYIINFNKAYRKILQNVSNTYIHTQTKILKIKKHKTHHNIQYTELFKYFIYIILYGGGRAVTSWGLCFAC